MKRTPSPRSNVKSVQAVLEALQKLNHATAQEILDWTRLSPKGKELSLTSVYRALNHLVSTSQVKPLNFNDGQVRYEMNSHHAHHHHFICTQCNGIQVVDLCPYEMVAESLKSAAFLVQYHNFDVYGLCRDCQTAHPAESAIGISLSQLVKA